MRYLNHAQDNLSYVGYAPIIQWLRDAGDYYDNHFDFVHVDNDDYHVDFFDYYEGDYYDFYHYHDHNFHSSRHSRPDT
jgi:hypothetical protein